MVVSGVFMSGSWLAAAHANNDSGNLGRCREAIRLADEIPNRYGEYVGTLAARSGARQADQKVAELTSELRDRADAVTEARKAFRAAAADC